MNSNENDVSESVEQNSQSYQDRKNNLDKNLQENLTEHGEEESKQNEAAMERHPVHRSQTDVQTKTKNTGRFRKKFFTWGSRDAADNKPDNNLDPMNLSNDGDSTEDIVDQLIEKLRNEKISSTPEKAHKNTTLNSDSEQACSSSDETASGCIKVVDIDDVVDSLKENPVPKPRKKSFRNLFSWISEEEEPSKSLDDVDNRNARKSGARKFSVTKIFSNYRPESPQQLNPYQQFEDAALKSPSKPFKSNTTLQKTNDTTTPLAFTILETNKLLGLPLENSPTNTSIFSHPNDSMSPEEVIRPILDELVATEESYVDILWKGIRNYYQIFERDDLPLELQGRKYELFSNIEDIAKFHRDHLLPMFRENQASAKRLFVKLQEFVESLQTELGDRLGISSFLLQPIQRMARYPLLLTEIIKFLYKQKRCPLLTVCCQLETKVRNLLQTINASECINDIEGIDMTHLFCTFQKFEEFQIYDYTRQRRYMGKLFLFHKTLIVTENEGKKLQFRIQYSTDHLEVIQENDGEFTLDYLGNGWDDCKCQFVGKIWQVKKWLDLLNETIADTLKEEKSSEVFYVPRNFCGCGFFEVYDHSLARSYQCKIFLFEKCLTLAEVQESFLVFRAIYPFDQLGVLPFNDYFTLFRHRRFQQECDFRGHEQDIQEWSQLLRNLAAVNFRRAGSFRRKFSKAMGGGQSTKTV